MDMLEGKLAELLEQNRAELINSDTIAETNCLISAIPETADFTELNARVLALEETINGILDREMKTSADPLQKLINSYRGNIWKLKELIRIQPCEKERIIHQRAYYNILAEKCAWIGSGSEFASIPFFPHSYFGVFVSNSAVIGKNAVIFQHVTIGSNTLNDSENNGSPTIGDNAYIGAGAKIIGRIKIGNNCRIGANAVVVTDIPDDSVVVMQQPRIMHKTNMDNRFYHYNNSQYGYHLDGQFHPIDDD